MHSRPEQSGQVLVVGLIVCLALTMAAISVANVGMMVAEKIHLQNTADASAYSAAVSQARYMNLSAYVNRSIIANYSGMAFTQALWASTDAYDHGLASVAATMYEISAVVAASVLLSGFTRSIDNAADTIKSVHDEFHNLNRRLDHWFAQDEGPDYMGLIERYNTDVLSTYLGLLYAAQQSARFEIVRKVARKMDNEVSTTSLLGLAGDVASFDDLKAAIDYVVEVPEGGDGREGIFNELNYSFNRITSPGGDKDSERHMLGALAEASLDKFSAGYDRDGNEDILRQFSIGNLIPYDGWIEDILDGACEVSSAFFDDCNANFDLRLGAVTQPGQEDYAEEERVPIISRKRLREVQHFTGRARLSGFSLFGLDLDSAADVVLGNVLGNFGYSSAEKHADVANSANVTLSAGDAATLARAVWNGNGVEVFDLVSRFVESVRAGSEPSLPPISLPVSGLNKINMAQAMMMGMVPPVVVDDHWDGTFSVKPVNMFEVIPPGGGLDDALRYFGSVVGEAADEIGEIEEGTATLTEMGVPKYDYRVNLDNVGYANYRYPAAGAELRLSESSGGGNGNYLSGPTLAVMAIKRASRINTLQTLGIGNGYSMSAMSAAQVYYVRNPNRPEEKPNLFNPYWVPRLRPIDSGDVPDLIRYGMSYLGSVGLPIVPTH